MKLRNKTTIPNERIKEMIAFAKPSGLSLDGYTIELRPGRSSILTTGRHWFGRRRIFVRVGKQDRGIRRRNGGGGYLPVVAYTGEEDLVYVVAHELRHAWQHVNPRGRRVWNARGKISELDADAYGIHIMREWRRK